MVKLTLVFELTVLCERGVSSSLEAADTRLASERRRRDAPGDGDEVSESDNSEIGLCLIYNKVYYLKKLN